MTNLLRKMPNLPKLAPYKSAKERVEIPACTDAWMRGDRYGTIESYTRQGMARVRLDKSAHIILCEPNELKPV